MARRWKAGAGKGQGQGKGRRGAGEWPGLRPLLNGAVYGPQDRGWTLLTAKMAAAEDPSPEADPAGGGRNRVPLVVQAK